MKVLQKSVAPKQPPVVPVQENIKREPRWHIDWVRLLVSFTLPIAAVGIPGALVSQSAESVYAALQLPTFAPQAEVFPVVWFLLALLMGAACYLMWMSPSVQSKTSSFVAFAIVLAGIVAWPLVFFLSGNLLLSAIIAFVIVVAAALSAILFGRIRPLSGWLLVPLVVWSIFAFCLSCAIALLN